MTENVAAPAEAVWPVGCTEIVMTGAGAVSVADELFTVVAPVAETTHLYVSPLLAAFVRLLSDRLELVAPEMLAKEPAPSGLRCHWYARVALCVTLAVTENVAAPAEAVWFEG